MNTICACTAWSRSVPFPGVDTPGYKDVTPSGVKLYCFDVKWKRMEYLKARRAGMTTEKQGKAQHKTRNGRQKCI